MPACGLYFDVLEAMTLFSSMQIFIMMQHTENIGWLRLCFMGVVYMVWVAYII